MREISTTILSRADRLHRLDSLLLGAEQHGDLHLAVRILELVGREEQAALRGGESQEAEGFVHMTPAEAREEIERFLREHDARSDRAESVGIS